MFRVTKSEVGKRTIITIDGQLSGDYVGVAEICCNRAITEGTPVDVFLHNVLIIDESGRALLTRLAGQGVRLLAAGLYTSYVVRDLVAAGSLSASQAGASGETINYESERQKG
jgi:hypothetical protein